MARRASRGFSFAFACFALLMTALLALPTSALAKQIYAPVEQIDGETTYQLVTVPDYADNLGEEFVAAEPEAPAQGEGWSDGIVVDDDEGELDLASSEADGRICLYGYPQGTSQESWISDLRYVATSDYIGSTYGELIQLFSGDTGCPEVGSYLSVDERLYRFVGWCKDSARTEGLDSSEKVNEGSFEENEYSDVPQLSLYAKWEEVSDTSSVKLTVTFKHNGEVYSTQEVTYGETATKPDDPIITWGDAYEFAGWTLNGMTYDFETPVKSDLILWSKVGVKDGYGDIHIYQGPDNSSGCVGKLVNIEDSGEESYESAIGSHYITKAGAYKTFDGVLYRFAGWCSDASRSVTFDISKSVNREDFTVDSSWDGVPYLSIYEKWEEVSDPSSVKMTVTFKHNGEVYSTQEVSYGETAVKPSDPSSSYYGDAYRFAGWELNGVKYDFTEPVTEDLTLYSSQELKEGYGEFAVSYGEASEYGQGYETSCAMKIGDTIASELENRSYLLPCDVEGYYTSSKGTFKLIGWYKDAECTQPVDFDEATTAEDFSQDPYSIGESLYIIHAKWEKVTDLSEVTYTVTFTWYNYDGEQTLSVPVQHGDTVPEPSTPEVYDHQIFRAWVLSASWKDYDFDAPVTSNLELYADTLLADGYGWVRTRNGFDGNENLIAVVKTDVEDLGLQVSESLNDRVTKGDVRSTSEGGYEQFVGWYMDEGLTREFDADALSASDFVANESNDGEPTLIVYGKWEPVEDISKVSYEVTFTWYNRNGKNTLTQTVAYGETADEPTEDIEGYYYEKFDGWTYQGEAYDFSTPVTKSMHLYAAFSFKEGYGQFVPKNVDPTEAGSSSVSYIVEFASGRSVSSFASQEDSGVPAVGSVQKSSDGKSYRLVGWYKDAELTDYYDAERAFAAEDFVTDTRYGDSTLVLYAKWEPASASVRRLWGATALDTMAAVSREGFADGSCGSVVLATMGGYWDALSATALAGRLGCPVLLTSPSSLSAQAASEISRLGAKTVYVAGGEAAVSAAVESQVRELGAETVRLAGDNAQLTALEVYGAGRSAGGGWGETAIVATSETFHDALSGAPYAYAEAAPVFLTNGNGTALDERVLSAIRDGGFSRVLVLGGEAAVGPAVAESLSALGLRVERLAGDTAVDTSAEIASFCLSEGMTAAHAGVATGTDYYDALTGASLCGSLRSPLVLATDSRRSAVASVLGGNASSVETAYVFGGEAAVSAGTYAAVEAALGL